MSTISWASLGNVMIGDYGGTIEKEVRILTQIKAIFKKKKKVIARVSIKNV